LAGGISYDNWRCVSRVSTLFASYSLMDTAERKRHCREKEELLHDRIPLME
jgi:hypothetical protein